MKKFLLIILFLPVFSSAGDWDLFPLRQISFFNYHNYFPDVNVGVQVMDSIKPNGTDTILYFYRNIQYENAGQCYNDIVDSNFFQTSFYFFIDSLVQKNDSVFYYQSFSSLPFYFLPKAVVGQSWTVTSTYAGNDYNQITITCSALQSETFFGISDSVKTFTMVPNGTSQNQTPVNNFVMKLSKNYGLIEYVPFSLFLYHPPGVDFFSAQLTGVDSFGTTYGFQRPGLQDYFHLNAGDVLMWKRDYVPANLMYPQWREYYKDSITQVFSSPDSVVYEVIETKLDTHHVITQYPKTIRCLFTDYNDLLKAPTEWFALQDGPHNLFHPWFFNFAVDFWTYQNWFLKQDSLTLDTISESTFTSGEYGLDTLTCNLQQTFDVFKNFTIDTRMGVTYYCYTNFDSDCYSLTGGNIDGLQYGSTDLPVGIETISNKNLISISPNPFTTEAKMEIGNWEMMNGELTTLKIYNSMGMLVREEKIVNLNSYILHRNGLNDGMYFFQLSTFNSQLIGSGKFIVN